MAKELSWRGRSEEAVKKLDLKEFMELTTSRQRRSLKRGFTDDQKDLLKILNQGRDNVKTHCRAMVILPQMVGKTLNVYNGKEFIPVRITVEMLGHNLGEFSHSRRGVKHSAAGIGATRSSKAISAR
ncbi:MAG: 30S ribosomal protein S19 [Candidatus Woesearchaeota archaeon]